MVGICPLSQGTTPINLKGDVEITLTLSIERGHCWRID